ncbi:unnamed protein product [Didymodactylos carnosus]|uniref:Uncharacterized protein n=1 Tax=Didymodactylos carnosus TaxID=1234261 RepID=A0A814QW92_9BILA|nr:unnamed protein product [Didymodactylos carnosus]CAF1125399.1 unnamed protein product [Didymodactylos carnosus]CAF3850625.1 unnamed protein product [Didymodactylos carnosus]CAF3888956.1 unnamed protein product [Didymodactylos carnosus]
MSSNIDIALSTLTLLSVYSGFFLLEKLRTLEHRIENKKRHIQISEMELWQLNSDISRSILKDIHLTDKLQELKSDEICWYKQQQQNELHI